MAATAAVHTRLAVNDNAGMDVECLVIGCGGGGGVSALNVEHYKRGVV